MTSSNRIHLAILANSNIMSVCVMCTCRCQKVGCQCIYIAIFSSSRLYLSLHTLMPCKRIALSRGKCSLLKSRIDSKSRLRGIASYYSRLRFDSSVHLQSLEIMNLVLRSSMFSGIVNVLTGSYVELSMDFALNTPLYMVSCSFLPSNTSYNQLIDLLGRF